MADITEKSYVEIEFSPSQVSEYELCARKWAYQWVDGLRKPKHASALFGIKTHDLLKVWLKKRVPPAGGPEAKVAQMILPHLPPPHLVDPANVEREAGIQIEDERFALAFDLWMPELEPPVIYDHKTTSDFQWALAEDVMCVDVQATSYAAWAMVETGRSEVAVQWTYGKTKGAADAHVVRAVLTREAIAPRLRQTLRSAREMRLILLNAQSAKEVPYDATACEAYGGCPFRELCNLSPQERIMAVMSQGTSKENYLEKLRNRKGANGAPASPGQVNPPPVVATSAPAQQMQAPPPAAAAPKPPNKFAARMAAKAAPPPEPELPHGSGGLVTPEPEPEAPAAEETPKRGRGRPTAEPKPAPAADVWASFAATSLVSLMGALQMEEVADSDMQEGVAQTAGAFADAMLKEYLSRFGG